MDYDDVIRDAGNDVRGACWVLNDIQLQGILRAAAPILMEYGARLMREAAVIEVEARWGHVATPELRNALRDLDPATIVREAVK